MTNETARYTQIAIFLHWLIALMIIGQIAGGIYMHKLPASETKYMLYQLHKSFGIMVLLLSILRLIWRLINKAPALPEGMKIWEKWAAKLTHYGFYVLIIGVPLTGWLMVSVSPRNDPLMLFGLIPWPHVPGLARSEALVDIFQEIHEYMAFAIIGLLVLHIGAALKHHFVEKDDVLHRMLPFLKAKSAPE